MTSAEDIEPKQVQYAFRDYSSSPDIRNCSLAAYITNFPVPELVSVLLRVNASRTKSIMFFSITTDVGEPLYQGSKPSSIRKVSIDQAEFLSDEFDSLGEAGWICRSRWVPTMRRIRWAQRQNQSHRAQAASAQDLPLVGLEHFSRRMTSRKPAALTRIKDPHRTIDVACEPIATLP
jgi:hypothetical protein